MEFYLPLTAFDVTARSKSGYFPQNIQMASHIKEFLKDGYRLSAEAVDCKFVSGDGTRTIYSGSVGVNDGFCKLLIMYGITMICHELELTPEQLGLPGVAKMLNSFAWVRCAYTHFLNPGHHYLNALRIQYVSSQKQAPSPLDFLGALKEAVAVERRLNSSGSGSKALREVLGRCVSEYNKMVTKKGHRIDSPLKSLILNMLRTNDNAQQLIHRHYDLYPHTCSALPVDVLQQDFWVPGSTSRSESTKFQNKALFKEILTPDLETCELWITRATEDFKRRAPPDASLKAKKNAQLDEDAQHLLHDVVCLWHWLQPKLKSQFPAPVVEKHHDLFMRGSLDGDLAGIMRAAQDFEWERIPFILEIRGECVDDFICQAQDRTRNAHSKSMAAAWNVWKEMLTADQVSSEKIASEKEYAKRRTKLVAQLEDMHNKAWGLVDEFMQQNLKFFSGRAIEAESTVLPAMASWIHDTFNDIPEVRSVEDHCIFVWINMTTVGVMPASKWDFFITALTNLLASHKRNAIAVLIHPNRASDTGRKSMDKKEKTEKTEKTDPEAVQKQETKDEDSEHEDEEENPEESDIRDIRHKLEKALSASTRNLTVKNLTWVFDKATVYGKRDGCIHGLAVVHRDRLNIFKGTPGFKHALIRDCSMLPRSQMYKPEATTALPHLGRAFTDAQELRQVAGGTDIVQKTLDHFLPQTVSTCLVVDLHCYDCWPALTALKESSTGRRVLCANIVLDKAPEPLSQRVANHIYEACRSEQIKVVGFPNFASAVSAIQNMRPTDTGKEYQVTVKKHDKLVILKALAAKWMDSEFKDATTAEIEKHNNEFNQDGEYWHEANETKPDDEGRPLKRIKLEESELAKEADVVTLQKPYSFPINNCAELVCGENGMPLYLEADEVMEDSLGRWFAFSVTLDTVMILEKKNLASHLAGLPCVDSPTPLATILRELEDAGEVKLCVTHHNLSSDSEKIERQKSLCFLMDPPKDREASGKPNKKKLKKAAAGNMTANNFGSILDISKLKRASRVVIGWRVRLTFQTCVGMKTLVPIRPIACLTGVLDLGDAVVKIF
ncbi:Uncharacterized protein SCF082_LOCUS50126 [Durusdinium trenchii]|uniref:Uncharacterized protein n=1 Tax=Durusdinium trenchii TaxID=1381693 RepID=A0ABP0S5S8_9DINO